MTPFSRRSFLGTTLATGAVLAAGRAGAASDRAAIYKQIEQRHDEAVQRLQTWIRQPSIAAENNGVSEGCDLTMRMLREAGFQHVEQRPTDGQPGIFATLDAGARRTFGMYFMYDVKQAHPEEWSSPPWEARLVDMPGLGKAVMGRRSWILPSSWSRFPSITSRSSSVSLPHFSLTLPLNCFQFPSTRFQSMDLLP